AVSDQVRKLEERFGVSLLRRSRRSVELTDLGERLLQWLHGCNSRTPHATLDGRSPVSRPRRRVNAPMGLLPGEAAHRESHRAVHRRARAFRDGHCGRRWG
ncbi:MAG: LysR family transcriptional regulator, partial [Halomonas sp.]|nr:LysR family transcriptional regulator [Halomonas sp.]